jgi:hypothetical protein
MFAFSVFWTYTWFSQYMLIWYSNQPEETKYFIERIGTATKAGPYKGIFFFNLIVNFLCPLLILMKKSTKRKLDTGNFHGCIDHIRSLDRFLPDGNAWNIG